MLAPMNPPSDDTHTTAAALRRDRAALIRHAADASASATSPGVADLEEHVTQLAAALAAGHPPLFVDYLGWARVVRARREGGPGDLAAELTLIRDAIAAELPAAAGAPALACLADALARLESLPTDAPSVISPTHPHAALAHQYLHTLLRAERRVAARLVMSAFDAGVSVRDLYLHVFQQSQRELGRLWQINEVSVAQEHYCTAATQLIMSQLYPHIFAGAKTGGTLVAASVGGELHELGVRMVADFFEMAGWDTIYLGANTPVASVVEAVVEHGADVLGMSVTINHNLGQLLTLLQAVRADSRCAEVKILVGGRPFNVAPGLWRDVGADGWAPDADGAVALAARLTGRAE